MITGRLAKIGTTVVVGAALMASMIGGANAADNVSLRLGWTYEGLFAPIYLGIDKGFFKENGIKLEVREGKGSVPSATSVANGQDDFGYFDMSAAARLIDKGLPIVGVAQIRQKSTMGILSLKKTGINKPKDLEGHSLSHTPGDSTSQIFPAFAKATNLDISKIRQTGLDYSVYLKMLKAGQVDATMGYYDSEGLIVKNQGVDINFMQFSDYGVVLVEYGIATSKSMIEKRPDLVKRFVAAIIKTFTYAAAHPDEATAAGKKRFPEFDTKLAESQAAYNSKVFGDSVKTGKPIGWVDPAVWRGTLKLLHDYMNVKDTNPAHYFTNDFINLSN